MKYFKLGPAYSYSYILTVDIATHSCNDDDQRASLK